MASNLDGSNSGFEQSMTSASKYVTDYDRKMASRQTRIESLSGDQRSKQESWAQTQLKGLSTNCVGGFGWKRISGGYKCEVGICLVTDELLAEGRGGFCQDDGVEKKGPFYPEDTNYTVGSGGMMRTRLLEGTLLGGSRFGR